LRPRDWELGGALLLAPPGAGLYVWALRSPPDGGVPGALATRGAYALIRHPIYLAFFAMLLATGFLASSGYRLAIAAALYLGGSEMRIAHEEARLSQRFPVLYRSYQSRTRWRYLPGLR
jgi:protein-S-isoprenylcysteine O-methyltransferase Ste14